MRASACDCPCLRTVAGGRPHRALPSSVAAAALCRCLRALSPLSTFLPCSVDVSVRARCSSCAVGTALVLCRRGRGHRRRASGCGGGQESRLSGSSVAPAGPDLRLKSLPTLRSSGNFSRAPAWYATRWLLFLSPATCRPAQQRCSRRRRTWRKRPVMPAAAC